MAAAIETCNEELHTIREAMRELNRLLALIENGEIEKLVLCSGNQMRAVVLTVEVYAELLAGTQARVRA